MKVADTYVHMAGICSHRWFGDLEDFFMAVM